MTTLRDHLAYTPQPLKFGTSGRRGQVIDLTQLEIYTNVLAEIYYLQSLPLSQGGIQTGDDFYYAYDLRPSSTRYVDEQETRRGGLCQAVEQALKDGGMRPLNLGAIPTPALTYFALQRGKGSIMVTGSHIPFDRNGYKLNTSKGELMKRDEQPINELVERTREEIMGQSCSESLFDEQELGPVLPEARTAYIQRFIDFFEGESLQGMTILAYQHSAVGRDLLVEIFEKFDATVIPVGRSETFVPIDTEAIDQAQLDTVQKLYDGVGQLSVDAVISTDGDSDRPLILAPREGKLCFFGGDLLGMIVAQFLDADAAVVPISANDAIDHGPLSKITEPKTKIGSPYVIAGMQLATEKGRTQVCGWEANGGFLTGSDLKRNGKRLSALPTRDAMLPLLCALFAAQNQRMTLTDLFATLPKRYSRAALLRNFPRSASLKIINRFSPPDAIMREISFNDASHQITIRDSSNSPIDTQAGDEIKRIRTELETIFSPHRGFGPVIRLNYTDGVRMYFGNGDVAHFRPSGNADELRIYAIADRQERADDIAMQGVAEPDGLLRRLQNAV
ncbi:phosphoglucomutase, putative [Talaromyces stipitatus ATCC 10500]|uniref:Phosphoglucomutase, putative n=1 Tax=Talaromyces stipitatus (strain ATCC 10500 / CBS 375.48 / QM 6759 / NRRL 1006) TaxID=441959 RepID=B8MBG9_TALSN|nr:phosphoglucomutase, putative [Talaromyces stipitatus ATCC 10500]EED17833.1 phosphoglucomutase, putative [Talaromyces stipitatus ATCC 10500]